MAKPAWLRSYWPQQLRHRPTLIITPAWATMGIFRSSQRDRRLPESIQERADDPLEHLHQAPIH